MAHEPRLARHEIALIKAMLSKNDMPKDRIQAYFSRPDRPVNYGAPLPGHGRWPAKVERARMSSDFLLRRLATR